MTGIRNTWLDIAKGITIILMVIGHTSIPDVLSDFIFSFHMPLFFIASGWTTNWAKYSICEFAKNKTKNILLPFCIYSIIVLSINRFALGGGDFIEWIQYGWQGYALWFIPVLYLASLIGKLIYSSKNKYTLYGFMIFLVLLGCILSQYKLFLPWTLSSVPFAGFLILLGSELKRFTKWIDSPRWWLLLGGFIISLSISHFWRLDMASNKILPVIPLLIGAVSGTIMIFSLSSYIEKFSKISSRILQAIGRETYVVVAFSQIIIMLMNQCFNIGALAKYLILAISLLMITRFKNLLKRIIL